MSTLKRWLLVTVGVLLTLQPLQVFAITEEELQEYSQNNITFYDPSECQGSNNAVCTAPTGDQITWIGDSYSVQAVEQIMAAFPGVDMGVVQAGNSVSPYSYIQGSKHMEMNAAEGNGGAGGVTILGDIVNAGKLRPYLVFALGTNDGISESAMNVILDKIAGLVGSNTKVILTTAYTTNGVDYSGGNNAKKSFAESHDNFYLADYAAIAKPEYYASDSIHPLSNGGYAAWLQAIKDALPKNCTAGLLAGNTVEERIWNYFVQAGIKGVSDNPAVIAGIMGNFYVESGYNPFMRGSNLSYRGLWMLMDSYGGARYGLDMAEQVNAAVGKDYWKFYGWWGGTDTVDTELSKVGASQNEIDTAIRVELEYLTKSEQYAGDWNGFVNNLGWVSSGTAGGYADLFLVTVERAVGGNSPIADPGVAQHARGLYQGAADRRKAAEDVFSRLSNMTTAPSVSTGSGGTGAVSSGGFTKYALTEVDLWDVAEAMMQDGVEVSAFKDKVSNVVNQYEVKVVTGHSGKGLMEYLQIDYAAYINGIQDLTVESEYLEAVRDVLINGNRTVEAATKTQAVRESASQICVIDEEGYAGPGGEDIARAAVAMAWPVQTGQSDDGHAGQCLNESGEWVAWNYNDGTCFHNPRDLYREQKAFFNIGGNYYEDCGWFAATALYYAEVDDDGALPKGGAGNMMNYMDKAEKWEEVSNEGAEGNLRPGDVFVSNNHISIYVGQFGGTYGKQVHASAHERVGTITPYVANNAGNRYVDSEGENFRIFRRVTNSIGEGGLTYEQAKVFMMNYGANLNNSSVIGLGKDRALWGYCGGGGSNCVTFSAFFINKFTDSVRGLGNGDKTVATMTNVEGKGMEPKVWAVFSGSSGAAHPHTGVILGYHDGEWIVGHASCTNGKLGKNRGKGDGTVEGGGSGFVRKSSNLMSAMWISHLNGFAYPKNVDVDAIERYLDTGE